MQGHFITLLVFIAREGTYLPGLSSLRVPVTASWSPGLPLVATRLLHSFKVRHTWTTKSRTFGMVGLTTWLADTLSWRAVAGWRTDFACCDWLGSLLSSDLVDLVASPRAGERGFNCTASVRNYTKLYEAHTYFEPQRLLRRLIYLARS